MKHLKISLPITLALILTACSDENSSSRNGNITTNTTTFPAATQVTPNPNISPLYKSLTLAAEQGTLSIDDNTTLKLIAITPDGESKELNSDIEYIITPKGSAEVKNNTLIAKNDGTITIQAKSGNTLSNTLTLTIIWTINGYTLPPEPNKALNDSTLLGIDSNNNGVRDDVERKIVTHYVKPIEIELMLSYVRKHQEMLADPVGSAIESEKKMSKVIDCRMYLKHQGIRIDSIVSFTENNIYNTKERVKAYLDFNQALSGGVYGSGPADWNAQACDFDVEQMLKDRK